MAKVTVKASETPSEQIISKAMQEVEVIDAEGRKIVLRQPDVLAEFQLAEAAGASSSNAGYMAMILPLTYVASIDGNMVPALQKKDHINALIKRLGHAGIAGVHSNVYKHFGVRTDEDAQPEEEQIKN